MNSGDPYNKDEVDTVIEQNLLDVRLKMAQAAVRGGRSPDAVRLIAITKSVGLPEIRALCNLGITEFGENRSEVAAEKIAGIAAPVRWHMIGSVQRRKAKDIVELFDVVDSVDRLEVAQALEQRCAQLDKSLPILLEVNVSGEVSKHGFTPEDLETALNEVAACPHLHAEGLMTMAPYVDDPEDARPVFGKLRELAERFGLRELSMGMSNDYEVAIEEGATQVRIGSALFE